MSKKTGIPLHKKWKSLKSVSYSETSNCTYLSQQAIPLGCMALQENLHMKDEHCIFNLVVLMNSEKIVY